MTVVPAGAQLGPADLPPPPPSADPREPSPTAVRGRSTRTPQRARSPTGGHHSRGSSPSRPPVQHHASSDASGSLIQPTPRPVGSILPLGNPMHSAPHLSRPSSPSSIHSSTSAIFERDIELPAVASLSINPNTSTSHTLSHKASRLSQAHGSHLDHTVPAVLDDAVEALAGAQVTSRGLEGLEIEAPAPSGGINMARQSSASLHGGGGRKVSSGPGMVQLNSRSPSPVSLASRSSGAISPAQSPPIMGQLSAQQASVPLNDTASQVGGSVPRPGMPQRMSTGPQLPGGWAFGHGGQDKAAETAPSPIEENAVASSPPLNPAHSPSPPPAIPSHLTPTKDKRRISFISYNDLLLSVPTTVTPLGDITSGNLSPEHLPGTVSPSIPTRSPVVASAGPISASRDMEHKTSWDAGGTGRGLGLGEGEWQREGLGKGLEQRLEDLVREDGGHSPLSVMSAAPAASTVGR